jgi:ribonuclease-3
VPRLVEALSDVLATSESVDELLRSVGEETANKCFDLRVSLQKGALDTTPRTKRKFNDPGRTNVNVGVVSVPAFRNNTLLQNPRSPPLPPISDATLQSQVFTHSARLDAFQSDQYSAANLSYERLEFIGDAYLECIASRVIFARFPLLSPGKLSQIRESLVKNETLAGYAVDYGFDRKLEIPKKVREAMTPKSWTKTLGDVFEAYVAAIALSSPDTGFAQAESWLSNLWESKLIEHAGQDLNPHAKSEIMKKLMGKGIKVEFREEREPQMLRREGKSRFFVGAYLTGWGWENQHLGSGVGFSKGEAGTRAAMESLVNVPLIDEIAAVKRAHDDELKARRGSEGSRTKD